MKNNVIYHSIYKGGDDNNYTANILQLTVIIDIDESDVVTFEFEKTDTDSKNEIQVTWQSAVFDESLYLLFSVKDIHSFV